MAYEIKSSSENSSPFPLRTNFNISYLTELFADPKPNNMKIEFNINNPITYRIKFKQYESITVRKESTLQISTSINTGEHIKDHEHITDHEHIYHLVSNGTYLFDFSIEKGFYYKSDCGIDITIYIRSTKDIGKYIYNMICNTYNKCKNLPYIRIDCDYFKKDKEKLITLINLLKTPFKNTTLAPIFDKYYEVSNYEFGPRDILITTKSIRTSNPTTIIKDTTHNMRENTIHNMYEDTTSRQKSILNKDLYSIYNNFLNSQFNTFTQEIKFSVSKQEYIHHYKEITLDSRNKKFLDNEYNIFIKQQKLSNQYLPTKEEFEKQYKQFLINYYDN